MSFHYRPPIPFKASFDFLKLNLWGLLKRTKFKRKLPGFSFLEILLSISLLSLLTLFLIHLSAIRFQFTGSGKVDNGGKEGEGLTGALESIYLEINNGNPKYFLPGKGNGEALLSEEKLGEKRLMVYGERANEALVKYRITAEGFDTDAKKKREFAYSFLDDRVRGER